MMANDPKMSKQMASAVNLLAHPAAGAAALSAIGIGMASQAFGFWLGVVEAAAEAQQRMISRTKPVSPAAPAAETQLKAAASKARAATKILMDEAQSFARDVQAEAEAKVAPTTFVPLKAAEATPPKIAPVELATIKAVEEPAAKLVLAQPKSLKKPAKPDDLKAISGIGPKLETVLNGLGVWTYRQIAGWSEREIGWVDDHLGFGGRIGRDNWMGQAKKLAGGKTKI